MNIGDINSQARGSGARFNSGKTPYDLIPLGILSQQWSAYARDEGHCAVLFALQEVGKFQMRESCDLLAAMNELARNDPSAAWEECARVFDYGRRSKYAEWNWLKGMAWSVPLGCIARHAEQIVLRQEQVDVESGLPHRGHIMCNLVMLQAFISHYPEGDNRPRVPAPPADEHVATTIVTVPGLDYASFKRHWDGLVGGDSAALLPVPADRASREANAEGGAEYSPADHVKDVQESINTLFADPPLPTHFAGLGQRLLSSPETPKPWYPPHLDVEWVEHDGKGAPEIGDAFLVYLTRKERKENRFYACGLTSCDGDDLFWLWDADFPERDLVAYAIVPRDFVARSYP